MIIKELSIDLNNLCDVNINGELYENTERTIHAMRLFEFLSIGATEIKRLELDGSHSYVFSFELKQLEDFCSLSRVGLRESIRKMYKCCVSLPIYGVVDMASSVKYGNGRLELVPNPLVLAKLVPN